MMGENIDHEDEESENEFRDALDDLIEVIIDGIDESDESEANEENVENERIDESDESEENDEDEDEVSRPKVNKNYEKRDWQRVFNSTATDRSIHMVKCHHRNPQKHTSHRTFLSINSTYTFLERYGRIESIQCGCNECVFVQFADRRIAKHLLKRGQIEMNGSQFQVKEVKEIHDQIQGTCAHNIKYEICRSLLKPPAIDSPLHILNVLDDSCLYEIVGKLHDIFDYMSIADVCTRFQRIAKETFPSQHKIFRFEDLVKNGKFKMSRLEHFLQNFGSSILNAQFHFNGWYFENTTTTSDRALRLINQYCKNINDLTIFISPSSKDTNWMGIRSILPNLKRLRIVGFKYPGIKNLADFVTACSELEVLEVSGEVCFFHLPDKTFPKLKQFILRAIDANDSLNAFLSANLQLEDVWLPLDVRVIEFFDGNLRNVKTVTLKQNQRLALSLELLQRCDLKSVELNLSAVINRSDMQHILPLKQIRELAVCLFKPFTANDLLHLSNCLPNLQYLSISMRHDFDWLTKSVIKELIECAPKLTELVINNSENRIIEFDEADYNEIVQILNDRCQTDKLKIDIRGSTKLFSSANNRRKLDILNTQPKKLTVAKTYTIQQNRSSSFLKHVGLILIMVVKILVLAFIFF